MGLNYDAVRFLLEAGQSSECFTSVLTLGRQFLVNFDPRTLASYNGPQKLDHRLS
jgi:hypothetical protein